MNKTIVVPKELSRWADSLPFHIYIAGGYVRNAILGYPFSDIDIAAALPSSEIKKFLPSSAHFQIVNATLDTAVIKLGDIKLEYTPFRVEQYEGGKHTPIKIDFIDDIYQDSLRRDFTCNAMYYDIAEQKIIDFHGGIEDANNKLLRAVNSPDKVFGEDGLRLMRLARFAAQLSFEIEPKTMAAAQKNAHLLKDISAERIRDELNLILQADQKYGVKDAHYRGLKLIGEIGLWQYFLPEMAECIGFEQRADFHAYDVYEHILQTVRFAPPKIRLAALFHDIGKARAQKEDGKMYRHPEIGVKIALKRLGQKGLRYPLSVIEHTIRLIMLHMYDISMQTRPYKMRLFVAENFDIIDDLVQLIRADGLGSGKTYADRTYRFEEARQYLLEKGLPTSLSNLKVNGNDILQTFPALDKRLIGKVLNELLKEAIAENVINEKDELLTKAQQIIYTLSKQKHCK